MTTKPDSKQRTAENRRLRAHFKRTSSCYRPNSWASPDGFEKINTSYFRLNWCHVENIWAEDEVKCYDTIENSGNILEWDNPDVYEKFRGESVKE